VVGERKSIEVSGFVWDFENDGNVEHLARHGVSVVDVYAVLASGPLFYLNIGEHAARYAMVGHDAKRRSLIIYLLPTAEASVWKPVTGWQSALAHSLLEQEGKL
jgi:hypothetical protein